MRAFKLFVFALLFATAGLGPAVPALHAQDIWIPLTGSPAGLLYAGAIVDPVGNRMVLFGGESSDGVCNRTWVLSLTGTPGWADVFDAAGRRVRRIDDRTRPAGPQEVAWDGRDDAANPVAVGVYFIRARGAELELVTRVVRTRQMPGRAGRGSGLDAGRRRFRCSIANTQAVATPRD